MVEFVRESVVGYCWLILGSFFLRSSGAMVATLFILVRCLYFWFLWGLLLSRRCSRFCFIWVIVSSSGNIY